MNSNRSNMRIRRYKLIIAAAAALALGSLAGKNAAAQSWAGTQDNNWTNSNNWIGGVPNSTVAAASILDATNNPVQLTSGVSVLSLAMGTGTSLDISGGLLSTNGGGIANAGLIALTSGSSYLQLAADTAITGTGTMTLAGGQIGTQGGGAYTLTNASTITGYGLIDSNSGPVYSNLAFNNEGTVNANVFNQTLQISSNGNGVTNSGTLEATNGGTLLLTPGGVLNNSGGLISSVGGFSIVNVNAYVQGGTLTSSGGGTLQTLAGFSATLDGSTHGAITLSDGSTYGAGSGTTSILGNLALGTSTGSTLALSGNLRLIGNAAVNGPGQIVMTGGQIGGDPTGGYTFTNNVNINGYGLIDSDAGSDFNNITIVNNGTVNANVANQTLTLGSGGGSTVTNTGTLEATNGGTLNLQSAPIADNGGYVISSGAGSIVNVNTTIEGGTLTTSGGGVMQTLAGYSATLDGSTQGAITLTDGSTYGAGSGTTSILGDLALGTSTGSTLALSGNLRLVGNTSVNGPGQIVLTGGQIGGDSTGGYTFTNNVNINGYGQINSDAGSDYNNLTFVNDNTVNANVANQTLTLNSGGGALVTNNGILEATNGGTLLLQSAPIVNSGASISAIGGGSIVNVNTTIEGGTLTTSGGGVMQTLAGYSATLDGSTQGALTLSDGSTYVAGSATTTSILGNIALGTSTGSTLAVSGNLQIAGNTAVNGPGQIVLTGGQIGGNNVGGYTFTNNVNINGYGQINSNVGSDYNNLTFVNDNTVNANVANQTLTLTAGGGAAVTNNGILEATNGGTLELASAPIQNSGATIAANGGGSVVNVETTIEGGTLTTANGGVMQTGNNGATLDGITDGAITISDGSTYTAGSNGLTYATGTINLGTSTGSTLALSGSMRLVGDLTLDGPGSLTISGGQIGTDSNPRTINNAATIQGYGLIGSNGPSLYPNLSVNNQAGGTILANVTNQTLTIGGTGTTTNAGTLEATTGATLTVSNGLTNYSAGTLTGGTYYANGGTIQLNLDANQGGGEITTDAAHITLSGGGAVNDLGNSNALSALTTIATNSSLTLINGAQLVTAASAVTNSGTLTVGANSSKLTVANGSFQQTSGGTFVEDIGGTGAGQYGLTVIGGTDTLAGTLDIDLTDGFTLAANTDYAITFMDSDGAIGAFSNIVCPTNDTCQVIYNGPANGDVTLDIDGPVQGGNPSPTPEPGTLGLLFSGMATLAAGLKMRKGRKAA